MMGHFYEEEVDKHRRRTLIAILKAVEWSETQSGPSSMAIDDGVPFAACPLCEGIDPNTDWDDSWDESAVGHSLTCHLGLAIDELINELRHMKGRP